MDDLLQPDTRPFFMDLWREHRFRVDIIAKGAGVSEETVFAMLRYHSVPSRDAVKVLAQLRSVYQQEYTLQTVRVKLIEENDGSGKQK